MPEQPAPSPSPKGVPSRRLLGLPAWAWAAAAVGGLVLGYIWSKRAPGVAGLGDALAGGTNGSSGTSSGDASGGLTADMLADVLQALGVRQAGPVVGDAGGFTTTAGTDATTTATTATDTSSSSSSGGSFPGLPAGGDYGGYVPGSGTITNYPPSRLPENPVPGQPPVAV